MNTEPMQGRIQSVARAMAVLDWVSEQGQPTRATVIARALGLNLATAHHLLATLVECGYLRREGRAYVVSGEKIATMNARLLRGVRPNLDAVRAMHRLAERTEETAFIGCWNGANVVIAGVMEGRHAVRVAALSLGSSGDAHARASGKVLLAFRPEEELERYLAAGPLLRRTAQTITDPQQLRNELTLIRSRGYAEDREEYIRGVWCVAAPYNDGESPPAVALSISMPGERFTQMRDVYLTQLFEECHGSLAVPSLDGLALGSEAMG